MAARKKKPPTRKASTWRQILFVKYYLENGGNGTQAMLLAGFKGTLQSAAVESSRMLRNANVMALMEREKKKIEAILNWKALDSKKGLIVEAMEAEKAVDRIKALLGLAKIDGLMDESKEVKVTFSPDEIAKKLSGVLAGIADRIEKEPKQ